MTTPKTAPQLANELLVTQTQLRKAYARIAVLEDALKAVRNDITKCGVIVWHSNIETTFDFIGVIVNDPVTWDAWVACSE